MLEIRNLSKSYGEKKAVCNLNLIVEDGDIMGFIGKNGAGKTTTLKSCLGIVGIDKGEILLDGVSILKEPIVCKKKMAYVPDNPQLDEYMTGIQYLNFIADIYAVPSQNRKYIIEKLASTFQMEPHLNSLISSYSHKQSFKQNSLMTALVKRERVRYFSLPVYLTNTACGFLFAAIFVVLIVFMTDKISLYPQNINLRLSALSLIANSNLPYDGKRKKAVVQQPYFRALILSRRL